MTLWGPIGLEKSLIYFWHVGSLMLWVQHAGTEWREIHEYSPPKEGGNALTVSTSSVKPEYLEWSRHICSSHTSVLRLVPFLPDRPVVVGSETALKVLPGGSALFFVEIPFWISINVGEGKGTELMELPTVVLSNTWFGGVTRGELCYSLKTTVHGSFDGFTALPHTLVCPVRVKNASLTGLDFKKLCIHVEHLKIYSGERHLWTNEVIVTFEGEDLPSIEKYSTSKPNFEGGCTLINGERTPPDRNIFRKSFGFLRNFTTTE